MKKYLYLDFETRSESDLKVVGTHGYAKHPSTQVLCAAFAYDDQPVELWVLGDPPPIHMEKFIAEGGVIVGHNFLNFDSHIWTHVWGFKPLDPFQVIDTMVLAYSMGLPGGLEGAGEAMGLTHQKDSKASRIMLQLCQPRSTDPTVWWDDEEFPEKYEVLYEYAKKDIEATRELFSKLRPLPDREKAVLVLDYIINNRGIPVDVPSVKAAIHEVDLEQQRLNEEIRVVSKGQISTAQAVSQIRDYIQVKLNYQDKPFINKANLEELLSKNLPDDVRRVLEIRKQAGRTSTAKFSAMIECIGDDGRIRNAFQYWGATTGRFAGRRVQFQNMKKGGAPDGFFEALHCGGISFLYSDPLKVLSDSIRSFVKAKEGCTFLGADFSAVEARGLAWLAGQDDVLELFAKGKDIYVDAAAKIYKCRVEDVDAYKRFIGKVAILALGYGGGKVAFQKMAKNYGVDIPDDLAETVKVEWRAANTHIVKYWRALESAAIKAVLNPTKWQRVGEGPRQISWMAHGDFLFAKLPSGRLFSYPFPTITEEEVPWGGTKPTLSYKCVDSLTRKWGYTQTHGGVLAENITQAVCRDALVEAMLRVEESNFPVVIHVHDSITVEIPLSDNRDKRFHSLITTPPAWAVGFPIAAEVWRNERFKG